DRLLRDGLARTERPRDGRRPAHRQREEHVEDAHAGEEGHDRVELPLYRTRLTHGPGVVRAQLATVLEGGDDVVYRVLAIGDDALRLAAHARRHEDLVGDRELRHGSGGMAGGHLVADLDAGREAPLGLARGRVDGDAAVDVRAGGLTDLVERTLDAVEDAVEHAGAKLDSERQPGGDDLLTNGEAARVLVDLDEGRVAVEADDLTDELLLADPDDVEHPGAHHVLGDHGRPRD